jgi:hypothetical protein
MRAFITAVEIGHPVQRLHRIDGTTAVVSRGTKIDLTVVAQPEDAELARIMDVRQEIILAPIPVRQSDAATEGALATWADHLSGLTGVTPEPEMHRAVRLLLPEVVALRREAEALREERNHLRTREARPLSDKLAEVAVLMQMVVECKDGTIVLSPKPPDPYEYDD